MDCFGGGWVGGVSSSFELCRMGKVLKVETEKNHQPWLLLNWKHLLPSGVLVFIEDQKEFSSKY